MWSRSFPRILPLILTTALLVPRGASGAAASPDADRQYRFAMALAERGDLARAVDELRRFLDGFHGDPRAVEVGFWLGYSLNKTDRPAEAAKVFGDWIAENPSHELVDKALFWWGEALAATGRVHDARAAWQKLVTRFERSPRVPNALDSLAWTYFRQGDWEEALGRFGEIARRFPNDRKLVASSTRLMGECLLRLGRPAEALDRFESLLARPVDQAGAIEARFGRAGALQALGRTAEAATEFSEVVGLAEKSGAFQALVPEAMLSQSAALVAVGRHEEALAVVSRLQRAPEAGAAAHRAGFWKGLALEALGRTDLAARAYEETLARPEAEGLHGRAAWQLAELRCRSGDRPGAVAAYDRVFQLGEPAGLAERALFNSAVTLGEMGRTEDALARAQRLVREFPRSVVVADALYATAEFLVRLERPREAADTYERFLTYFPTDARVPEVRFRRAWCLNAAGSEDAAREELAALLRANPAGDKAAEAAFLLAELAKKAGRIEEAERSYRKVVEAASGSDRAADALWALATIARDAGRTSEAAGHAARLARDHQRSEFAPWALLLAGDAALAAGDAAAALADYRTLISEHRGHELQSAARSGEAWALLKSGDRAGALASFQALAAADPASRLGAEASYRAAVILREDGRAGEGRELLDKLISRQPAGEFAEAAWFERALCRRSAGDVDGCIADLEQFERLFPRSELLPGILREMALAYYERKDPAAERAVWKRILDSFAGSPAAFDAHWGLAALAEAAHDDVTAAREYAQAASAGDRPEAAEATCLMGECLLRLGNIAEARAAFTSIATRFPGSKEVPRALATAGRLALDAGEYVQAMSLLRRAEAASPGVATVDLAGALRKGGDARGAKEVLDRMLAGETDANSDRAREARLELALTQIALGRQDAAEKLLAGVAEGRDDEIAARAQHALASVYYRRGDFGAAERAFYQLLVLYPQAKWQAEARFRLGQTSERLRDYERARQFYRELVRENAESPYAKQARERLASLGP